MFIMLLHSYLVFIAFCCTVNALPQAAPSTIAPAKVAAVTSAPNYSVEVVTLEYIFGTSSFEKTETLTDYGTVLPTNLIASYGSGVMTADLPIETDPCGPAVQYVFSEFLFNSKPLAGRIKT